MRRNLHQTAAAGAVMYGLFAFASAAQNRPLVLLGDSDYPPLSYLDHGQPAGMDVELARAIAKVAGRQLRIELMDWDTAQQKVLHGEADGVLSMSITDDRKRSFDFTEPTMDHEFGLMVRSNDLTIHGVDDLAGKVVAVTPGGFPRTFLSELPDVRLILVENSRKGMDRLAAGTIDAVAADLWVAAYTIQKNHLRQIAIAGDAFATRSTAIALRKGNPELVQEIDRAIAKTRADGSIDKILARWRPQEMVFFSIESVHRLVMWCTAGFLLLVVGAMAIWVRTLKRQIRSRQAAEADLLESRQRLDVALSAAHLGTWRWCAATNMVTRDANLSRLLGLEPVEVTYAVSDVFQRVHPDDLAGMKESFIEATRDRNPFAVEYRIMRPEGAVRWFRLQGKPFFSATGELLHLSGAIVDITERKDAEEERRRLEAQLRQSHKMETVGRLAGGIAHDFNNLLTVINGYSSLLAAQTGQDATMQRHATAIHRAGERAAALTQQLLAFSRRQVTQAQPVHLNTVAADSLRTAGVLPEAIELRHDFRARPDWVVADPGQIQTVLANLVANARDAMPGGGWLRVETASVNIETPAFLHGIEVEPGPYVCLSVIDNGIGMDAETLQHIFEPFFTTKEGNSTGLGLSTVYGILRQYGGFVRVDSRPGAGAAFHLYWPLSQSEPAQAAAAAPSGAPLPQPGTETILVVEDEANVRELAMETLRSYGYSVLGAGDGRQALRIATERPEPIHVLLTDVVMPGMNGRALAEQLQPLRPETKVIYMSGYSDDLISQNGMVDAGIAYVAKPFAGAALAAKVREVLDAAPAQRTILVADDEEGVRSLLEEFLTASGYHVLLAGDGKEVFEILRTRRDVDLVITDLVMPQQEGIETVQAIRKEYPAIKIVAMSGAFGGRLLKTVKLLGAHATLVKPIDSTTLRRTVDGLLIS